MRPRYAKSCWCSVLAVIAIAFCRDVSGANLRPLEADDILGLGVVGQVYVDSARNRVLVEWVKRYDTAPNLDAIVAVEVRAYPSTLGKIYAIATDWSAEPKLLFPQAENGGYWMGGLSPSGNQLAVYSMLDGSIRAGVVNLRTEQVTWFDFTPHFSEFVNRRPVWRSEDELIYPVVPPSEQASIGLRRGYMDRVNSLWDRAAQGAQPSVTVARSATTGLADAEVFRPGSLVRVRLDSSQVEQLATGRFYALTLAPGGNVLAAVREAGMIQKEGRPPLRAPTDSDIRRQLVIINLQGKATEIVPCPRCNVGFSTIRWSLDGARLSFRGQELGSDWADARLFTFSMRSRALTAFDPPGFQICHSPWAGIIDIENRMILLGHRASPTLSRGQADCGRRNDWFVVSDDGALKNLTTHLEDVPQEVIGITQEAVYFIKRGVVSRLKLNGSYQALTSAGQSTFESWDSRAGSRVGILEGHPPPRAYSVVESASEIATVDLARGQTRGLLKPTLQSALVGITPSGGGAVFVDSQHGSTRLLYKKQDEAPRVLLTMNEHLSQVQPARRVTIDYGVTEGLALKSCLLVPADWTAQKRYPMIVNIYPVRSEGNCDNAEQLHSWTAMNLQFFAGRGYIVLFPAAPPSKMRRNPDDGSSNLADFVLRAVDGAVSAGYANPDRIGLYGFSQGMREVLRLLTKTQRFKAAVALNGLSNFTSAYGATALSQRFNPDFPRLGDPSRFENSGSDTYIGLAPWEAPQRYIDASPIFFANKIATPLLLVNSDLDMFSLTQADEMFVALSRLRKEAEYVVYWGEGHGNASPANVRDLWSRLLMWYDRYLDVKRPSTISGL